MPHSSGGGSHSSGFHSSGSHSSHSGSSSSGSSGPAAPHIYHKPHAGAVRYVYYTSRSKRPHYLYCEGTPVKPSRSTLVVAILLLTCIALPGLCGLIDGAFHIPAKVDTTSYRAGIVLDDTLGILGDEAVLEDAMQTLLDTTGVSPALEVVSETAWMNKYDDLETFALNEYLRRFNDEKHWLFVLSYPEDYETADFVNWQWEGMIGDEVDCAIDTDAENRMTQLVHRALTRSDGGGLAENLAESFIEFSSDVMKKEVYGFLLVLAALVVIIYAALVRAISRDHSDQHHLYSDAVKVRADAKERQCEYCGGYYVAESIAVCPYCGAPVAK